MASIAGAGKSRESLVGIVVAVVPAGPRRRLAAGGTEMTFKAFPVQIMAIRTVVLGLIAVELGTFAVQPHLIKRVIDALAMTVMADLGTGAE